MIEAPAVYIIDDDEAVRNSLRWLLESVKLNVKTFDSAEAFFKDYSIHLAGCLLLDIRMPGMSGLQLQQEISKQKYPIPVIIVTGHGDIPMAVNAMKHGAMDFVEKPFNDQEMLDKIRRALEKDKVNHAKRLEYNAIEARIANLTRREREVLEFIAQEHSNRQIAQKLHLSIKTIESHRANLMEKMHADSLIHLLEMLRQYEIKLD